MSTIKNTDTTGKRVLKVISGTKTYQGSNAIENIDFDLFKGEIHGLVGENGAGKSTLCKALAGAIKLSSGNIWVSNRRVTFESPRQALKHGIAMVYQETSLVPGMTVAQNIELGREKLFNRLRGLYIQAQQTLQTLNFDIDPTLPVALLSAAERQMVEIARAVGADVDVIIFDEPTASLTPEEKIIFFDLVRILKTRGISVIFISHALEESLEITDRITVLRDGKRVITEETAKLTRKQLVRYMVGRDLSQTHYNQEKTKTSDGQKEKKKVLVVDNVVGSNLVQNMSFSVYSGEVTGIAGLVGSGRTEIAQIIAGVTKRRLLHGGMIYLDGRPIRYRVPRQAINDGIVYVTEDRKVNGFFETMNVSKNIYLGWLATRYGKRFIVSKKDHNNIGSEWTNRMQIHTLNRDAVIKELSGGNQQKVTISKSLVQRPKIIIIDEPTKGVDVGTIPQIHNLIRSLAEEGVAVIVISSYLPEVLSISDRILVAKKGRIVEEFLPQDATEEKIIFAAVH
ncbi:MAG: sugar ABC transporter ATP-binding protein [Deltaproteobacteria bacterium]|jgi:ABC-type sugar transport system ATPase subunit|nr:sugar ABC transporter ATP-binding protein [Deltaproteobacteria bacterium]MBT4642911.1 sugar ABC transporter ATP-binding protein [Deltaproteobacteria bacterium]